MDPNSQRPQISTHRTHRVMPRSNAGSDIIRPRPPRPDIKPSNPIAPPQPAMQPQTAPIAQPVVAPQPVVELTQQIQPEAQQTPSNTLASNPASDIVSPLFGNPQTTVGSPQFTTPQASTSPPPQQEATQPNGHQPIQSPYSQLSVDPEAIPKQKAPLPKGIYLLIGLMMVSVVLNFFHASNIGDINTFIIIIEILLALGLLTRHNIARRALMIISAIYLVLSVVFIVELVLIQNKMKTAEKNYNAAVAKLQTASLNDVQREALSNNQTELNNLKKQAGKNITRAYIYQGLSIAEAGLIIWYLTRPKVKSAFEAS